MRYYFLTIIQQMYSITNIKYRQDNNEDAVHKTERPFSFIYSCLCVILKLFQENLKRFAHFRICENLSEKFQRIQGVVAVRLRLLWLLVINLFIYSAGVGNSIFIKNM